MKKKKIKNLVPVLLKTNVTVNGHAEWQLRKQNANVNRDDFKRKRLLTYY